MAENAKRPSLAMPFGVGRAAETIVVALATAIALAAWQADRGWYELHIPVTFCTTDPRQLHRLNVVRVIAIAFATLLVIVVRPHVARQASRRGAKEACLAAARMLIAVTLAIVVTDLAIRAKHAHQPSGPLTPAFLPPVHAEPQLGWISDQNTTTTLRADGRDISYAINTHGFRASSQNDLPDPEKPSILFVGESYTEGLGVFWEESYPALVGADFHVQALEAAVHGYGNDQAYLAMQRELPTIHHPIAVVTLIVPQQLERDLQMTRPGLQVGRNGTLALREASPAQSAWWLDSPVRKLTHAIFPYHADTGISLARAVIAATAHDVEARGAYALFVLTNWGAPCLPGDRDTPSLDARLFYGQNVHSISVTLDPSWIEHTTYHPNPAAHRVLADAIEQALIDARVAEK